jgi:trimeric autotransporter adhesin
MLALLRARCVSIVIVLLTAAGCGDSTSENRTVVSIAITPAAPSIANGTSLQLNATATFSDRTTTDVTSSSMWASSDPAVASVSDGGMVMGLQPGTVTITATRGGIVGTTMLVVTDAILTEISVTPSTGKLAKGTSLQLAATGLFSDGTKQNITTMVTWTSATPAVATITPTGKVQAVATGNVTVSAKLSDISGTAMLTVTAAELASIEVTPASGSLAKGTTQTMIATGIFTDQTTQDLTTQVAWSSGDTSIASVDAASGLVTAKQVGSTTITATLNGVQGSADVTVTAATLTALQVTPTNTSIPKGVSQQYTATGVFSDQTTQDLTTQVTWASSNELAAVISNTDGSRGLVTTPGSGATIISASFGGKSASTNLTVTAATLDSISVTPTNASAAKGTTRAFTATGVYTDATVQDLTETATWDTSDSSIATVSNLAGSAGVASALLEGSVTVSATFAGKTGSASFTVTVATLSRIDVTPTNPSIARGTSEQLTATGVFSDNTTQDLTQQVTWASSNGNVAGVSNAPGSQGLVVGVSPGPASISATSGSVSGSTTVTVTAATLTRIDITPPSSAIAAGTTQAFTATGVYSDNSTQDLTTVVTWDSSNSGVATVSNADGSRGLATGVAQGSATISAAYSGVTGTTTLTVTAAALTRIDLTPSLASIAKGTTQSFVATGVYSDNSTQDLTTTATWSSSDGTIASISNAPGSEGVATGVGTGSVTITASSGGITGQATLTVSAATLVSVDLTPTNPSIAKGTTALFIAIGTYTDGTTQDLTTTATWSSSDELVATVSNAAGEQGLATAINPGTATISATVLGKTGTTTLTVTAATLSRIDLAPPNPSIAKGTSLQLVATGTFTDGTTQDLTPLATWGSLNTAVATVSNVSGQSGLLFGAGGGTTTINAVYNGITGSTTVTVTVATLQTITIEPANPSIANGTEQQFTATGTYADGTVLDITTDVTWSSSNTAVATISNALGFEGNATSVSPGTTTITATLNGVTGMTTLTVTNAVLRSIALTPANPTIHVGEKLRFTATGTFSDGTTQNLTLQVSWSTSNRQIATVTNARKTRGTATGVSPGTVTISATLLGIVGSTQLTVIP